MLKNIAQTRWIDLCLVGLLSFLVFYSQPFYPTVWFDEGMVMQGAMNLLNHGQYAMNSVDGFRVLDQPLIANGPGVILPIYLAFSIWGIGFLQARLVIAVYFIFSLVLFIAISRTLYGKTTAWISVFLLLALPEEGFIFYGRQILGNMPAFAYFLAGCFFFVKLIDQKKIRYAIFTGLFWGIAMTTKGQYMILLPVFALAAVADHFYYKRMGWKSIVAIASMIFLCLSIWQAVQYRLVGAENYQNHLDAIASSARVTILAFEPQRIPGSAWYLIRSGFPVIILPCLLVALHDSRRKDALGIFSFFLGIFVLSWLFWYLFASVGWKRYAFEMFSVASLMSGVFIQRVIAYLQNKSSQILQSPRSLSFTRTAAYLFLIAALIWSAAGFINQVKPLLTYRDLTVYQFAGYLMENIPDGAVVESWEWEIDPLTPDLTYHHPANSWVDVKTAEIQFGAPLLVSYELPETSPDYLIDGLFSKMTDIYTPLIQNHCCRLLISFGNYDLYKVK
jgi:4-amino-4-deoxy-L-arabinose transferase-like glycosyltransferase